MTFLKRATIPQLTALAVALGLAWLSAEETAPPTETVAAPSGDKWAQIKENNDKTLKELDELQQTIDFIRLRVMRGGRAS